MMKSTVRIYRIFKYLIALFPILFYELGGFSQSLNTTLTAALLNDDPPIARPDSFSICTDRIVRFTDSDLLRNDTDPLGDPLKIEYLIPPDSGTFTDDGQGSYSYTPEPGFTGIVIIQYVIKKDDGFTSYQENKHFYEFVTAPQITWQEAKTAAENSSYQGMQGYLVTITSAGENAFVSAKLKGQGWIGASDQETEGIWRWVTGPEAGLHFSDQYVTDYCQAATAWGINGNYANWYEGEPNNCGDSGEDYAHFYPGGVWNDYPNFVENIVIGQDRIAGYIVEYGGLENLVDLTTTGSVVISVAVPDISIIKEDVSCFGTADGSIDLAVSGGIPPYSYSWSNGSTTPILTDLSPGYYSVALIDSDGCSSSAAVTITEPEPLVSILPEDSLLCSGSLVAKIHHAVTGGTEPYSYLWSNGETTKELSAVGAGRYRVTVQDAHGCTASSEIVLSETESPVDLVAHLSDYNGYSVSCKGSSNGRIELEASGGYPGISGYSYVWEDGLDTWNRTNLGAGNYRVVVTDSIGCSQKLEIALSEPPQLELRLIPSVFNGGFQVPCKGSLLGSATSEITGGTIPFEILWSNGETTKELQHIGAGIFSAVVRDANGCTSDAQTELREPDGLEYALVKTPPSCNECENGSLEIKDLQGGLEPYTIQWNAQESGNRLSGLSVGNYSVTITDANGCMISEQIVLDMGFRIPNAFTPNADGHNDLWEIRSLDGYPLSLVRIFTSAGKLVFESDPGYPEPWNGTFEGNSLPTGTYYYLINLSPDQKPISGNLTLIR